MKVKPENLAVKKLHLSFKPYFMGSKAFVESNFILDSLAKRAKEALLKGKEIALTPEEAGVLVYTAAAFAKEGVLKEVREVFSEKTKDEGKPFVFNLSYSPILLFERAGIDLKEVGGLEGLTEEALKVLKTTVLDADPTASPLEREKLVKDALIAASLARFPLNTYLELYKELQKEYSQQLGKGAYRKAEAVVAKQITHLQDYYQPLISDVPVAGILKEEEGSIAPRLAAAYLLQRLETMAGTGAEEKDFRHYYQLGKEFLESPQKWQEEVEKRLESEKFREAVVYNYALRGLPLTPKAMVEDAGKELVQELSEVEKVGVGFALEVAEAVEKNLAELSPEFSDAAQKALEQVEDWKAEKEKEREQARREFEEILGIDF